MRCVVQLVFFVVHSVVAPFDPIFEQFLINSYGPQVADALSRKDLGDRGSYGGDRHDPNQRASDQAVVLVHGITNSAGTFYFVRKHFESMGHPGGSVYATTYGDAGRTMAPMVAVQCQFIKQTRMMIQSVAAYSRRKVDVIAYSMGSPVARKAIMGGSCVDTGEYLGPPLTALVDTFVSVAGANFGSSLCLIPFPGACNAQNGLNCRSYLLADINSAAHYEGDFVFSIYSHGDDKVGFDSGCGTRSSTIQGSNQEFIRSGNHDQVMHRTVELQRLLVTRHFE